MLPIDRLNVDRRYCRLFVQKPTTHKPISSINILQSYISNIMMTVDICSCNIGPVISRWTGFFLKMCQTTELMLATGILPLTKTIMTSSKLIHIKRVDKSCIYWYFCCSSQKTTSKVWTKLGLWLEGAWGWCGVWCEIKNKAKLDPIKNDFGIKLDKKKCFYAHSIQPPSEPTAFELQISNGTVDVVIFSFFCTTNKMERFLKVFCV